jgi:histidinol-phosphate aminotransferase
MVRPMSRPFPDSLLRDDVPRRASFTVSDRPCRAKLDQNESPLDLPREVKAEILADLEREPWNRYPQPSRYAEIKGHFAACIGQPAERIVLTVGCDQMILLAFWAAGGRGRRARVFEPAYPMYGYYAGITQTELDSVVLGPDFAVEQAMGEGGEVELLLLVSPNNPTGEGPGRQVVLEALARPGLVFVDESYADYSGQSVVDLVVEHSNLLVARSLSKSMLAGVRLGFGVGHPELITALERLLFAPYHLNALQLAVANHYGRVQPYLEQRVQAVVAQRERVAREIQALGLRCWSSRANFLLFAAPGGVDAGALNQGLLQRGVRLRDVSSMPGLSHHLRVTIGTAEENDIFLEALASAL